ncbi:MAG: VOC family protein [Pseudomonadota bacterium]
MSEVNVNWFEIPVLNTARAAEFYATVLGTPLDTIDGPDGPMQVFAGSDGPAGALWPVDTPPAHGGVMVYLGCDDIDAALDRAVGAGGAIESARASIGPFGFIGRFRDTEGNVVALHSPAG